MLISLAPPRIACTFDRPSKKRGCSLYTQSWTKPKLVFRTPLDSWRRRKCWRIGPGRPWRRSRPPSCRKDGRWRYYPAPPVWRYSTSSWSLATSSIRSLKIWGPWKTAPCKNWRDLVRRLICTVWQWHCLQCTRVLWSYDSVFRICRWSGRRRGSKRSPWWRRWRHYTSHTLPWKWGSISKRRQVGSKLLKMSPKNESNHRSLPTWWLGSCKHLPGRRRIVWMDPSYPQASPVPLILASLALYFW